ncbi:MAG: hypothetical protein FJ278_24775, partial [Planctomycetes bacterium]|nr:hypothetical protein [Planctomycetota bacterium]
MTSRERVTAALAHKTPDRTPIFEYVLQPPVADAILGRAYLYGSPRWAEFVRQHGWKAAVQQQATDMVDLAKTLGHDMLYAVPNALLPKPAAKPAPPVPQPDDPVEAMTERVSRAEANFAPPHDDSFLIYSLVRQKMDRAGLDLPILAPAYGHGVWTDTTLMQVMILDPALARRHFALATRRCLALVRKYVELGVDMIGVGGDFAGNRGPIISPPSYRDFIVPEVRKVSQAIHAARKVAINASDGSLWPVIDDFIVGCEVDGYLEIDLRAGMDLATLKRRLGD